MMKCVHCGKDTATEGSMKHPYCKPCFRLVYDDDMARYWANKPIKKPWLIVRFWRWLEHLNDLAQQDYGDNPQ